MKGNRQKQILIVFPSYMDVGGIERSLISLLDVVDYDRYEVDLFLYGHHGPWMGEIDSRVRILPEVRELAYLRESFAKKLKHGCFYAAALRLLDGIRGVSNFDRSWAKVVRRCVPRIEKHYDVALGFFRPFDVIAEKVDADLKVGWIHTDYSKEETDQEILRHDYQRMDRIAAVSEECRKAFLKILPEMEEKTFVFENILSPVRIRASAQSADVLREMPKDGSFRLLSIGRFSYAKNFDRIPDICRHIREADVNITWYLIGYGNDESLIRTRIAETGMEEHVILLGKKENPYPYLLECDLYVQPSRYEGKCVSVREAQILGKPVVITAYPTAPSQLTDGVDGVIVPLDDEGCAQGIVQLLRNPEKMRCISSAVPPSGPSDPFAVLFE